jgi:general secretion pathway protein D
MVYIEALFMEVDMNTSLNIGIDWTAFGSATLGGKETLVGGGFSPGLPDVPGDLLQGGLTLGMITDPVTIAGIAVSNITAIIHAVKTDDDFRILSTPQVLTTDNEEARIVVGENRPFQTRSTTDDSGGTFESFEYRDVAQTLKVTPHVTEDRLVRMQINFEITTINQAATLTTSSTLPVTNKRTVDTTVIVKDEQTIVIGGLIGDTNTDNENKVPGLGDVPLLGWLFKNQNESNNRTNLFIFITPRVIKNPQEGARIYRQKQEEFNSIKEGTIKFQEKHPVESKNDEEKIPKPIPQPKTQDFRIQDSR